MKSKFTCPYCKKQKPIFLHTARKTENGYPIVTCFEKGCGKQYLLIPSLQEPEEI